MVVPHSLTKPRSEYLCAITGQPSRTTSFTPYRGARPPTPIPDSRDFIPCANASSGEEIPADTEKNYKQWEGTRFAFHTDHIYR
jgi:hypothetical protein